ncbi:helix-turn-helix domain-containing protein [Streptomyces sp. NPDC088762]|uniref:helix-turn-helix domain-containing protein n=1 Tax=Streptomyces sp. NPDC088762 TaxID=3365891 RepID=UPI00382A6FDA
MTQSQQLKELGKFLIARRGEITPAEVGLPVVGFRRTPGLRREEVALLAGVGVSWYTWIEQGRAENVSAEVLGAISRVLNLDYTQRQYIWRLAGLRPDQSAAPSKPDASALQPYVDNWLPNPAYITDRVWDITVANRSARELLAMDGGTGNILRDFFTRPETRNAYPSWEQEAPAMVARFRSHAANYSADPLLAAEIDRLCAESPEFADHWVALDVQEDSCGVDILQHPLTGPVSLKRTTLDFTVRMGVRLTVFFPVPGTSGQESIEKLAAEPRSSARRRSAA